MVEMGVVTGAHVALPVWSFMVEMGVVASPSIVTLPHPFNLLNSYGHLIQLSHTLQIPSESTFYGPVTVPDK